MSEEIFINTGTSFQQQYTARQPAISQVTTTAQRVAQGNASSQAPFTYNHRQSYAFRSPSSAQSPSIGQARQPSTYARQGQTPDVYQARSPFTYPTIAQIVYRHPTTYQNRQPGTYPTIAQIVYPYVADGRNPSIYQHPTITRSPSTYQHRTPSAQQNTGNHRQSIAYPANMQTAGQQPSIVQSPSIVQVSSIVQVPSTFAVQNPSTSQSPSITVQQSPSTSNQSTNQQTTTQQPSTSNVQTSIQTPSNVQTSIQSFTQVPYGNTDGTSAATLAAESNHGPYSNYSYVYSANVRIRFRMVVTISGSSQTIVWQISRGGQDGNEHPVQQAASNFFGSGGNSSFNSIWRTVETWVFTGGNTLFADTVGFGSSVSSSLYSATSSATHETYKQRFIHCEESIAFPFSGSIAVTYTVAPNAQKSGYPTLTTNNHSVDLDMSIGCYGSCFFAGTQVLLSDNTTKNIELMEAGDAVIGQDGVVNAVVDVITVSKENDTFYTINGGLQTTPSHPFLTTTGWKCCDITVNPNEHADLNMTDLEIGDFLVKTANDGTISSEEVTTLTNETIDDVTIYNLDVTDSPEGNDTYVVDNYVVHNK